MDESDNLSKSYVWGIDISGSEQGAGGVGGLLMASDGSVIHFPAYDGNGNITAYTDGSSALAASYEYSPFGALTASSGSTFSPFRFSTKCYNTLTGLYYYGFRYYSPRFARWINRDPIGEQGGINLYGMVGNDAVNNGDYLGQAKTTVNVGGRKVTIEFNPTTKKVDITVSFVGITIHASTISAKGNIAVSITCTGIRLCHLLNQKYNIPVNLHYSTGNVGGFWSVSKTKVVSRKISYTKTFDMEPCCKCTLKASGTLTIKVKGYVGTTKK